MINSYLRINISQERVSGLAILSIEKEILVELEYKNLIINVASCKRPGFGWALKRVFVVPLWVWFMWSSHLFIFKKKKKRKNELNLNFIECIKFTNGRQFISLWLQSK